MTKRPIKRATRKLQLAVLTKVFYLSYATLRSMMAGYSYRGREGGK
jgi:hypothetical protein